MEDELLKSVVEREYKQAILSFKAATTEEKQWAARRELANLEKFASETYGFAYSDSLHQILEKELGITKE